MPNEYSATEQPDPIQNTKPAVWELVLQDMEILAKKIINREIQKKRRTNPFVKEKERKASLLYYTKNKEKITERRSTPASKKTQTKF
jgi:hypothetical protein